MLSTLEKEIQIIKDFPQKGVIFRDIFPLLAKNFEQVLDAFVAKIENKNNIDYVVGLESRGFILAAGLAARLQKGFIPVRKKGKLPPPTLSQKITLEYGEAEFEMKLGSGKVILVDDVMATGGSMKGALELSKKSGYEVVDTMVLINLKYLNSHNLAVQSIFEYLK